MIFNETPLSGVYILDLDPRRDQRGFFSRAFCAREFKDHGLNPAIAQVNLSFNLKAGVLRGMHYQIPPAGETKLVRCIRGAIYDVVIDLRPDSPTHLQHFGVELTQENRRALYVPEMFAHGYQTLAENTEVLYNVGEFYSPDCERGLRHDDPAFGIQWPLTVSEISEKDRSWPLWGHDSRH